jgi:glycosyltransferase involved in cell wall biosynthesis
MPLTSIITVVYNGEKHLEQTIRSVIDQTYKNIEYLVIDGGSTDGTLDIIRRYEASIDYWVSEPDHGISDAMNKGIAASSGEIIGLLHADDWYSPDQVERGVNALIRSKADFVFGDLYFHDAWGRIHHRINGNPNYGKVIHKRMPELCHPTVLVKRTVYEKFGLFDTEYRIAMDYEWFLRVHKHGGRGEHVKGLLGHMRLGGISDTSYIRELKEVRNISVLYGQPKWAAGLRFCYRIMRTSIRRRMQDWLPACLSRLFRMAINRQYSNEE